MLLEGQSDTGSDDAADVAELREAAGGEERQEAAAEPAIPPAPEPNKPVALAQPKSRRAQAEEDRKAELKAMNDRVEKLLERDSQRDRQMGEITGHLSALAQRQVPQYQPPQQQAPQIPDPEDLLAKANAALDGRDMGAYHRYLMQANQAATMRQMAPVFERVQQMQREAPQQQNRIPDALVPYFAAYPEVATHPAAQQLLMAKNAELEARGFAPGPGRVKAVFDEVRAVITAGQNAGRPGFDPRSAAALSGTPTARPASGGGAGAGKGEPRVDLTPEERMFWKKAGFTDESELAANIAKSRPERIIR